MSDPMDRRTFLAALGLAGLAACVGCSRTTTTTHAGSAGARDTSRTAQDSVEASAGESKSGDTSATAAMASVAAIGKVFGPPTGLTKRAAPAATITRLPGSGKHLAYTVDDGVSSDVVAAYAQLCKDTGLRLTFFVNGTNSSWTDNAPLLRPLVESGQIVLGNHTYSHQDLTKLTPKEIVDEVTRNKKFLKKTYGVTGEPFFRPPFGFHSKAIDARLADMGYPTIVMWYGSLADSGVLTPNAIEAHARKWLHAQHIVIAHANHPAVIEAYPRIIETIRSRNLLPVTLGDVYSS
jgi:peptidoglycan/xylan/chitin deacetylase (PgdA/CDA1 family)